MPNGAAKEQPEKCILIYLLSFLVFQHRVGRHEKVFLATAPAYSIIPLLFYCGIFPTVPQYPHIFSCSVFALMMP